MTNSNNGGLDSEALKVLDYWIGLDNLSPDGDVTQPIVTPTPRFKLWFAGGKKVDDEIRGLFETTIDNAETGQLDHWSHTSKGLLALIIVLDQFPLNAFRKTARAFHLGDKAVPLSRKGIERGFDQSMNVLEKLFFYLPLEHSELISDQQQSLELFQTMHKNSPPEHQEFTRKTLQSAQEHFDIIEQFGRYPFRNAVLDRKSTEEELAWLEANPGRFGQ